MESLAYSWKQVEVLLEATKVLIPVNTGYVLIVIAGLRHLQKRKLFATSSARRILISSFLLAIVSIGFWSGVLAFMVDCSQPFELAKAATLTINTSQLNLEWRLGLICAQLALISFFASIALYSCLAYKLLMSFKVQHK